MTAAWAGAEITWSVLTPPLAMPDATVRGPELNTQPRKLGQEISDAHLLGGREQSPPVARKLASPHTPLELLGVYSTGGGNGFAFIRAGDGQELYRRGTALPGDRTLAEVHPRHAVIEGRAGHQSRLVLRENTADGVVSSALVAERVASLRARAVADPESLARLIEVQPYRREGAIHGYRLIPRQAGPVLEEIGLREGDILLEMNGVRLNSPASGIAVLEELVRARVITARIERDGHTLTVEHRLD